MDQSVIGDVVKLAEEVVKVFVKNETPCRKKYEFTQFSFFQPMESPLDDNVRAQTQKVLNFSDLPTSTCLKVVDRFYDCSSFFKFLKNRI